MARFEYAQSAIDDLDMILGYTAGEWGVAKAEKYLNGLEKQAQLLAEMPTLGKIYPPYKEQKLRVFPFEKHLIYYLETDYGVTLLHLTHNRMDQLRHLSNIGNDNL
ncbi:type II toxin-antitoxin system RelE/ParE family toxin [Porticoccus sp. W117]|uniref:type II toxin-antitoxin system RelE/ParE family toxin n=1 Tax=Porticoccus sp. W117 TaxID=3054777 RepID=UPI00259A49C6|nr:type II toxin-antitoxin system RelE/ParE family toxin [Porticoccus sp. W117]MDM3870169.1 type II toxin-antitoxin system RelE/ParE family toxin [Porticoccus sp. W117]